MLLNKLIRTYVSHNLNCFSAITSTKWLNAINRPVPLSDCLPSSKQLRCFSLSTQRLSDRRYHDKHEWVTIKDRIATVGISNYAQKALGDIVFVELPEMNRKVEKDDEVGCVESTKSANDIYSPLSGKIIEVNELLETQPHLLNSSPHDEGWIYRMEVPNDEQFSRLMDEKQYETFVKVQTGESTQI